MGIFQFLHTTSKTTATFFELHIKPDVLKAEQTKQRQAYQEKLTKYTERNNEFMASEADAAARAKQEATRYIGDGYNPDTDTFSAPDFVYYAAGLKKVVELTFWKDDISARQDAKGGREWNKEGKTFQDPRFPDWDLNQLGDMELYACRTPEPYWGSENHMHIKHILATAEQPFAGVIRLNVLDAGRYDYLELNAGTKKGNVGTKVTQRNERDALYGSNINTTLTFNQPKAQRENKFRAIDVKVPDGGYIPEGFEPLCADLADVFYNMHFKKEKWIVHCVAGKGRAGLISLAFMLVSKKLNRHPGDKSETLLNEEIIKEAIEELRSSRPGMVQADAQLWQACLMAKSIYNHLLHNPTLKQHLLETASSVYQPVPAAPATRGFWGSGPATQPAVNLDALEAAASQGILNAWVELGNLYLKNNVPGLCYDSDRARHCFQVAYSLTNNAESRITVQELIGKACAQSYSGVQDHDQNRLNPRGYRNLILSGNSPLGLSMRVKMYQAMKLSVDATQAPEERRKNYTSLAAMLAYAVDLDNSAKIDDVIAKQTVTELRGEVQGLRDALPKFAPSTRVRKVP